MLAPIRTLILDYGGVLVRPPTLASVRRMATLCAVTPEAFSAAYWEHRPEYDLRGRAAEYWARVLRSCGQAAADPTRVDALREADAASWMVYLEEVWEIAAAFRASGGRTALLSNGVHEIMGRVNAARPLDRHFDVVLLSCDVDLVKPDPAIYRLCLERLGSDAGSSLFVDDRRENVEGAVRAGLQALLFTGEEVAPALRQRLGLSAGRTANR